MLTQVWKACRKWKTAFRLRWLERIEGRALQEITKNITLKRDLQTITLRVSVFDRRLSKSGIERVLYYLRGSSDSHQHICVLLNTSRSVRNGNRHRAFVLHEFLLHSDTSIIAWLDRSRALHSTFEAHYYAERYKIQRTCFLVKSVTTKLELGE